jgi:ADP-ribosylglycohydrolase
VYEWHNIKTKEFELFDSKCFFTDDSVLTIALADSILTGTPYVENLDMFYGGVTAEIQDRVYAILDEPLGNITREFMARFCAG